VYKGVCFLLITQNYSQKFRGKVSLIQGRAPLFPTQHQGKPTQIQGNKAQIQGSRPDANPRLAWLSASYCIPVLTVPESPVTPLARGPGIRGQLFKLPPATKVSKEFELSFKSRRKPENQKTNTCQRKKSRKSH
jgi:hypothetical protein